MTYEKPRIRTLASQTILESLGLAQAVGSGPAAASAEEFLRHVGHPVRKGGTVGDR